MENRHFFEEKEIITNVVSYLEKLGYSKDMLSLDFKINNEHYVDIAIFENKNIVGVVEVKTKLELSKKDIDNLPYNRVTRRIQRIADENSCNFYVLSNGVNHIWFKTGKSGRAEILSNEVRNIKKSLSLNVSNFDVEHNLNRVIGFLNNKSLGDNQNLPAEFSTVLLYCLVNEIKLFPAESLKIYWGVSKKDVEKLLEEVKLELNDNLKHAIDILSMSGNNLIENSLSILKFINKFLRNRNREIRVPFWLNSLMLRLAAPKKDSTVANLFGRDGSILDAASDLEIANINIYEQNLDNFKWISIRQILLRKNLKKTTRTDETYWENITKTPLVDSVVFAPHFNVNIRINEEINSKFKSKKIDSTLFYIDKASELLKEGGTLVVVVPDGLLFNQSLNYARKYLFDHFTISAIISLPIGTFHPYASVNTSILVINKYHNPNKENGTFIGSLDNKKNKSIAEFDIEKLLSGYSNFVKDRLVPHEPNSFVVRNLNTDNFHNSKYMLDTFSSIDENISDSYKIIPLKELALEVTKGASFVKDDLNEVPYVNPANIRRMELNLNELLYTSKDKIPTNFKKIQKNDILINAISSHRGSAALVKNNELYGLGANRHVIIVRPNTKVINPEYLALVLNSQNVRKQLFDLTTGAVIPSITLRSLEGLAIPVPSHTHQIFMAEEYNKKRVRINKLREELNDMELELTRSINDIGTI